LLKLKMLISTVMALGIGGATLAACGSPPEAVSGVGSDTTFWVMSGSDVTQGTPPANPLGGVSDHYNASQTAVKTFEVPPVLTAPFPGPSYVVNHDNHCTSDITYNGSNPPPNGSSQGITALVNDTNGCVDFARSSRGAKAGDPASLSFWAFGLDALTWVKFPGTHAPVSLTPAQLTNIYTCSAATGLPLVSNWNQVGGASGTIVKYAPQTGSGTYSFLNSKLLGGATVDQNCNASHKSTFLEEHDATGVSAANKPNAIYVFSVAQWQAQSGGRLVDLRNGAVLGQINGVSPNASSINTSPTRFFGTRYVYNVTKSGSPSEQAALAFVGVKPGGPGYLCNNGQASTISAFGFAPLASGGTGAGLPASNCRLNPTPL
jgi:ABC-type phosphate transport system substrate-binding protein